MPNSSFQVLSWLLLLSGTSFPAYSTISWWYNALRITRNFSFVFTNLDFYIQVGNITLSKKLFYKAAIIYMIVVAIVLHHWLVFKTPKLNLQLRKLLDLVTKASVKEIPRKTSKFGIYFWLILFLWSSAESHYLGQPSFSNISYYWNCFLYAACNANHSRMKTKRVYKV